MWFIVSRPAQYFQRADIGIFELVLTTTINVYKYFMGRI